MGRWPLWNFCLLFLEFYIGRGWRWVASFETVLCSYVLTCQSVREGHNNFYMCRRHLTLNYDAGQSPLLLCKYQFSICGLEWMHLIRLINDGLLDGRLVGWCASVNCALHCRRAEIMAMMMTVRCRPYLTWKIISAAVVVVIPAIKLFILSIVAHSARGTHQ